jgi:hypothetical protein
MCSKRIDKSDIDSLIFRDAAKFFYNFFGKKALFSKEKKSQIS